MRVFKSIGEYAQCVGQEIGVSDWIKVDQSRVNMFADATLDHQWIHVDTARAAKEMPTKNTIVHGYLTLSLLPYLQSQITKVEGVTRGINYGSNRVRFMNMVPTGSRVRARQKLVNAEAKAGGVQFTNEFTIEIEGLDRPACVAETITVLYG